MKKKAFTLTELLVVVVIIGVLSAVVLPKFNKVIESRRTAEAESVMRAVRNEQEMRCTLDQNYTTNKDKLAVWPKRDSANYTYALNEGGMSATRKDKDYTLEIKTYLDGGICCSGTYCSSLNKDYPLCDDYEATPNTKDCVPANVEEESDVEPDQEPEPDCEPTHNGQTTYQEDCPSPQVGSITYRWNVSACKYEVEEHCSETAPKCGEKPTAPQPETKTCPCGEKVTGVPTWNEETCQWNMVFPDCKDATQCNTCQDGETKVIHANVDPGGCSDVVISCVNGQWDNSTSHQELKEGNECWAGQTKGSYSCVQCRWGCGSGKVEIDGQCCLAGQKVKNGKCLYKYRPNRFNTGVLVNCHDVDMAIDESGGYMSEEDFNSGYLGYLYIYGTYEAYKKAMRERYGQRGGMTSSRTCTAMNYAHYRGGQLPTVSAGDGCTVHHAYYNGGKWWSGGIRITGNYVYGSDQDWCDNNCGSKASCNTKGIISQSAPNTCGSYHCSNGWHCDNAEGTGVALECIRE